MLDAFLPSNCLASRRRKWVLLAMINGTVGDCFSHYGVLRDDAVSQVARALIPRMFNIFQRQRWLKHVKCISEIALLFVYAPTFIDQAIQIIQKGKTSDLLKDPLYHFIAAAAHADEEEKRRQENQQRRVDLLEWVRSKPGPRLLRMALCMQPAARFMQVQLQYASSGHDKEVLLQSALQKDGGLLHASVAAASGAYTTVFWDELGQAWTSPDYWKATPQRTREKIAR